MSTAKHTITDAEYAIMKVLWRSQVPLTVGEVLQALGHSDWTASTVSTFLQRLLKKGVVSCQKKGRSNLYFPLLQETEYDLQETETFLSKLYKGSVKNLVAALYENQKLSQAEIDDLRTMFDLE